MDLAAVKNEIKIIFYIINSFIGLIPGSLLFGFGIAISAGARPVEMGLGMIALGMVGVGIATLGFAGAILDHKIMLIAYSCVISLVTFINIVTCLALNVGKYYFDVVWMGIAITHLSLVLVAVGLTVTQARLARHQADLGRVISPAPAQTAPLQPLLHNDDSKVI